MSAHPVTRLNRDLRSLAKDKALLAKAQGASKTDAAAETKALDAISTQKQAIIDQFESATPPTGAQATQLLDQLYGLGQSEVQTKDSFTAKLSDDKRDAAADKKGIAAWEKRGLKDLKAAEYRLNLKDTNRDRKELGLKPVKHVIRPPHSSAVSVAKSVLGKNISYLKYHGELARFLDKWPPNSLCCANFVSAVLEKAGQLRASEHSDNVAGLAHDLRHDGRWRETSLRHAKPGDVVCFDVPGEGHWAHTEIFEGWKNGKPMFIGSNNVNPDGSQRITQGTVGYAIDAVFHYHG